MTERPTLRFRLWVNEHLIHDGRMSSQEAIRGAEVAQDLLRPNDRYLIVVADLAGRENPRVEGNDEMFADRVIREEYPGLKLPMDEARWQRRNGIRYHEVPPDGWDGIR